LQLRYADLDHQVAAQLEVRGDIFEVFDRRDLGGEFVDRVEDEVRPSTTRSVASRCFGIGHPPLDMPQ
jgi:hypothetical protein